MTDEEIKRRISERMKALRKVSLAEIARRAGTYPTTIKEVEDGVRMPGAGLLTRIAQALGTDASTFLDEPPKRKRRHGTRKKAHV